MKRRLCVCVIVCSCYIIYYTFLFCFILLKNELSKTSSRALVKDTKISIAYD